MSLINDALKRVNQAKPPPPPTQNADPPLRPVEYQRRSRWPFFLFPALLLVGLAGWLFFKGWQTGRASVLPAAKTVLARELPAQSVQNAPPPTVALPGPAPNNRPEYPAAAALSAQPTLNPATAVAKAAPLIGASPTNLQIIPAEPAKPTFPSVRLQGIFYRPNRPSAMLNARTAYVGDKIANVKVVAITRDSVTVEWNGETRVLTLE